MTNLPEIQGLLSFQDTILPLETSSAAFGTLVSAEQVDLGKVRITDGLCVGKGLLLNYSRWTDCQEWHGALSQLNELERWCRAMRGQIRSLAR